MANRLANETSPYLLQHAHNPVDWYPWGREAIQRARFDDKPILLSIGYSACHWCHVMERESFENEETARMMNEYFVCIKVDREERPDLDSIYMQAVQALTGHGGWPMTMFLTPDLEPFWGGTYFPPDDRPGMPSFRRVLTAVGEAYLNRSDDVEKAAAAMREMYATGFGVRGSGSRVTAETLDRARRGIVAQYDKELGGFGGAPKFPHAMAMEFLLQQWARTGDKEALDAAHQTFLHMARGGIYDQVGGGFARYSVDERWLVPHFEKMLYDNALLLRVGVHLWQATTDAEIRRVCEEVLVWLRREMTSPSRGFYSTLDADSEGEEGKFYLWDVPELRSLLGSDADAAIAYWGVSDGGNFEGRNILHVPQGHAPDARIERARKILYEARSKRAWPARDEKILASWNGLMLRAVAEAARAFDSREWRALALENGEFLFREMVRDGRVLRSHKDGTSRIAGFLEDHAAVALGALALYELTFDRVWLDRARSLADAIGTWFWDDATGAFYDTATDHEELITR
ncbi:MAG TPA: thioredoxin domain-containing protein, partial [Gemmatimonadaceae bacterium]